MSATGPGSPSLRASDAERERTATQLREHCAAGRLTPEELDERIDVAYRARTVSELQELLIDLPPLQATPSDTAPDAARERAKKRVLHGAGTWVLISLAFVLLWLVTGTHGSFWPQWIILLGAIRLALLSWSELGPGADERRSLGHGHSHGHGRRHGHGHGHGRGRGSAAEPGTLPHTPQEAHSPPEQR